MKRNLFYSFWFLLSIIQAFATELFDDEAYYWVYSKYLDWGYFDHPPMIAWLIKAGTWLIPGELGVRILLVILGTATIACIEYLTQPKNPNLFYGIILGVAVLQIGGFMAVPDIPLLFFASVFFIAYKKYTETFSWLSALGLSISIALLLYSKYHGLLLVVFTLLSHLSLLKKPQTWFVMVCSIFFFWPHVNWQLQHDLPSLQYHLHERLSPPYRISFTTDFLVGQLLITGPLIGWLIIWSALRNYPKQVFQKAMYWSIVGTYLIFFVSSFRSRTEANWTIALLTPLIVLSYPHIESNLKWKNWIVKSLPVTLVLIFALRIYMVLDIKPILPKDEFHKNKEWVSKIKSSAKGRPVVFTNSYQRASKYWFYSGDTAFSLNTYRYRRSNYNIWPVEEHVFGKEVFVAGSLGAASLPDTIQTLRFQFAFESIPAFRSFSRVSFSSLHPLQVDAKGSLEAALKMDAVSQSALDSALKYRPRVMLLIYPKGKLEPIFIPSGKRLFPDYVNMMYLRVPIPDSI
ncbi:MAG: hypothetical protein RL131_1218, partial [Bacteroidota bacterium]